MVIMMLVDVGEVEKVMEGNGECLCDFTAIKTSSCLFFLQSSGFELSTQ